LGAGASYGALHPAKRKIPLGSELGDRISDKFLGGQLKDRPLTAVAAMAAAEVGLNQFQKFIREEFIDFQPADFHLLIPTFRWRAIATTNFDLIIERAYDKSRGANQSVVKSWKDGDLFDTHMREASDPVGLYKLHGCIDHYLDSESPLILSMEQYASYSAHRMRFYNRLRDIAYENPIVFCGYGLGDPHIQQFLFDLTDKTIKRPQYYFVNPLHSEIEARYWAGHQVTCVAGTFAVFLTELDRRISVNARALRRPTSGQDLSLQPYYNSPNPTVSDNLRYYLDNDVTHLHSGYIPARQDAVEFYKGYDTGFGCITQNLDIQRTIYDSVIVDAILLDEADRRPGELFLIKGPGGNGKTVALKRIAWDAAITFGQIALYANGPEALRLPPLEEIHRLTGKRIFLFVDRISLFRTELEHLLKSCRAIKLRVTIIGAERENEWHIYCDNLEQFLTQDFSVGYLSEAEISNLIAALERHRALGLLRELSPKERVDAFLKRAERQLLVALHETTQGLPFEQIILDEYNRIRPEDAKHLYLQICALHQFGAPVRAGLISRSTGIRFSDFGKRFLLPLADVVLVEETRHSRGDVFYRSRHQRVAELVFTQVLSGEEEKYDLLATLTQEMNVDYSSDRETFSRLIKGRSVADIFSRVELGRLLYDKAEVIAKDDSFVPHQRAVFELRHPQGSLAAAEEAAARAASLNPNNRSIRHTEAEIARRRANAVNDPLRKQSFRRSAKQRLSGPDATLSEYDLHTRARLAIDELRDIIQANATVPEATAPLVVAAAKEAELAIQRGRIEFPENGEILAAEADLKDLLNQAPQALSALERAFKLNPRQDWLAIRLAKRYAEDGEATKAIEVVQQCLKDNPDSKAAHLELGMLLSSVEAPREQIIEHFRKSFVTGDTHFEGQFWYARELFLANREHDSIEVFNKLSERAPGKFRTAAGAPVVRNDEKLVTYEGSIARREEGYAFVRLLDFSVDVFASRGDSPKHEWDRMLPSAQIRCNLAFNRRGPRATRMTIKRP
jgi:tetratricopeptide (TPR) repeat protein